MWPLKAPLRRRCRRHRAVCCLDLKALICYNVHIRNAREVLVMVRLSLRVSEELHEKLRWVAYKERRSQYDIMLELLEKAMAKVQVPKEVGK